MLETFYEACGTRIEAFPCSGGGRLLQHVQVSVRERQPLLTGRQRCCARNHGQLRNVHMNCAPNGIVVFHSRPAPPEIEPYGTRALCFCKVTNRKGRALLFMQQAGQLDRQRAAGDARNGRPPRRSLFHMSGNNGAQLLHTRWLRQYFGEQMAMRRANHLRHSQSMQEWAVTNEILECSSQPRDHYEKNSYDAYTVNNLTAKRAATAPSRSSSEAATGRFRIACRSLRAGITRCGSIVHARRS